MANVRTPLLPQVVDRARPSAPVCVSCNNENHAQESVFCSTQCYRSLQSKYLNQKFFKRKIKNERIVPAKYIPENLPSETYNVQTVLYDDGRCLSRALNPEAWKAFGVPWEK